MQTAEARLPAQIVLIAAEVDPDVPGWSDWQTGFQIGWFFVNCDVEQMQFSVSIRQLPRGRDYFRGAFFTNNFTGEFSGDHLVLMRELNGCVCKAPGQIPIANVGRR